ncbi:hypothetical protein EW15_2036 [Prochlorococcus sp. MIT 0801]|nr:hypothetical protein EW15_2036 [Prochlorococcus sp. MIT 0801]
MNNLENSLSDRVFKLHRANKFLHKAHLMKADAWLNINRPKPAINFYKAKRSATELNRICG